MASTGDDLKAFGIAPQKYASTHPEVTVEIGPDGQVAHVAATPPDPEEVADAINYVAGLLKSHKVAVPGQPAPAFGTTHTAERDEARELTAEYDRALADRKRAEVFLRVADEHAA